MSTDLYIIYFLERHMVKSFQLLYFWGRVSHSSLPGWSPLESGKNISFGGIQELLELCSAYFLIC